MNKQKIRLCPNCKKTGIELYAGWTTNSYICKKCGYLGPIVIEQVPKTKKAK
ncbi:MAG TPA: hypothetical protein VI968_02565 [archaeon]|nr:hypothetical protein [archaeon]